MRRPPLESPEDPLEAEEVARERARILAHRYPVLFRQLLDREAEGWRWRDLSRALRLMELGGELLTGRFLEGVHGLQLASPAAVRALAGELPADRIWGVNATDPASPCSLGLDLELPRRTPSTHLVYHGWRLVLVSERLGRRLRIDVAPDHPQLGAYLAPLRGRLGRAVQPARSVTVEEINGERAASSHYRGALGEVFHIVATGGGGLRLSRRY